MAAATGPDPACFGYLAHGQVTAVRALPGGQHRHRSGPGLPVAGRTGKAWWQYGAATETPEAAAAKRMTRDQLRDRITALHTAGLIGPA